MNLNPDEIIVGHLWSLKINLTVLTTWFLMFFLIICARLISKRVISDVHISRWQGCIEMLVLGVKNQIEEIGIKKADKYVGFLGSLFVFLFVANLFSIIPGYRVPTGSLSTTTALATCVLVAEIIFGITNKGFWGFLKTYAQPNIVMLPFNIISEFSRTFALAVRLFGNMMSGEMMVSILIALTPFFFPMIMTAFSLLIGMIQAYIFTVLAAVYIAAATQIQGETDG